MKKIYLVFILLGLGLVSFTGCSSKTPDIQIDDKKSDLLDAPSWVNLPRRDGMYVEIGSASKNSKNDLSFQRAEAMADARDNLARLLKIAIDNNIKANKTKSDDGELTENHEHTSTQTVQLLVRMSTQQALYISKSGQMFVLIGIDKDSLNSTVNKQILK
jgi:hypothetical protein